MGRLVPEDGPDLANRDPNNINDHLQIAFEEVFGEPEHTHSIDCAWKCVYMCYNGGKNCCYLCLTTLLSWFCGLCWGCEFACLTFCYIYCLTPSQTMVRISLGFVQKIFTIIIDAFLGPLCAACGMFFSNVRVSQ